MRWLVSLAGALLLAGCIGVQRPTPTVSYSAAALVPTADEWGYYTFGTTRYKGPLVNGVPDGSGLCVDTQVDARRALPCRFALGNRTDEAYVEARRRQIAENRAAELAERREREASEAAWAAQQRADRAAGEREMRQAVLGSIATLQQNARQLQDIDRQTAQLAAQAQQQQRDREAQRQADMQRERDRVAVERAEARQRTDNSTRVAQAAQSEQAARLRQDMEREEKERQAKDAERQRLQVQREAEQKAQRDAEAAAARRAQEKAEREAAARAAKEAEAAARRDYLAQLVSGTKLYARTCPSGDGNYFVVGMRPRIKPELVSCVDVHYEALCEGSSRGSTGVAKNFLGAATDCFMGDTATIAPKPACPVKQVRVEVRTVRACNE